MYNRTEDLKLTRTVLSHFQYSEMKTSLFNAQTGKIQSCKILSFACKTLCFEHLGGAGQSRVPSHCHRKNPRSGEGHLLSLMLGLYLEYDAEGIEKCVDQQRK